MKFDKFITNKAINNNSIAKYANETHVKLVHEYDGEEKNEVTMTHEDYENLLDSIPYRFDSLAYMLDSLFNCSMLEG